MKLDRRQFLTGLGVALASCALPSMAMALPVPQGNSLSFRVTRKGGEIGLHRLDFRREGDRLTVNIAADIAVKFGFLTLFRYTHRATEIWEGGQPVSVSASTNDDGKKFALVGVRQGEGWKIDGASGSYIAPANAMPATHWNRRMLDHPMINTQNGKLMEPEIARKGVTVLTAANGRQIEAEHYSMSGDAMLDTWYDATPAWAGLSFKAKDGSEVLYQKIV